MNNLKRVLLVPLLFSISSLSMAQGAIYECVATQSRHANAVPVCKKVSSSESSGVEPTAPRKPAAALISTSVSPASFPKIDDATQKARDSDRKQILLDEAMTEQKKLQDLRREFNNGQPLRRTDESTSAYQQRAALLKDELSRSEQNIAALSRELTKLK